MLYNSKIANKIYVMGNVTSHYINFFDYKEELCFSSQPKKIDVMKSKAFLYINFFDCCKEKLCFSSQQPKKIENLNVRSFLVIRVYYINSC